MRSHATKYVYVHICTPTDTWTCVYERESMPVLLGFRRTMLAVSPALRATGDGASSEVVFERASFQPTMHPFTLLGVGVLGAQRFTTLRYAQVVCFPLLVCRPGAPAE